MRCRALVSWDGVGYASVTRATARRVADRLIQTEAVVPSCGLRRVGFRSLSLGLWSPLARGTDAPRQAQQKASSHGRGYRRAQRGARVGWTWSAERDCHDNCLLSA